MVKKTIIFFCGICVLAGVGYSQSTRDVGSPPTPPEAQYQSHKKEKRDKIISRWFSHKQKNLEKESKVGMRKAYRQYKKEERLAEKPQYGNPAYFGHKKPPIKRPPGKQKYCKECHLRH